MENEHLIHGLLRKRADLAGQMAVVHDQMRVLQADLAHVEATVRMFQPDIDFSGARVSRKPGKLAAEYGEMSKLVRAVLRDASGPVTIKGITASVMEMRGLGEEMAAVVNKRVGATLRNLKRRGQADSRHGVGGGLEWRLSDWAPLATGLSGRFLSLSMSVISRAQYIAARLVRNIRPTDPTHRPSDIQSTPQCPERTLIMR